MSHAPDPDPRCPICENGGRRLDAIGKPWWSCDECLSQYDAVNLYVNRIVVPRYEVTNRAK